MNPISTVSSRMDQVPTIHEQATEAEEVAQLADLGVDLAAVVGDGDELRWLARREGRRSALRIAAATPLTDIQAATELLECLNSGASGLVVVHGRKPVGFLPLEVVIELLSEGYLLRTGAMGDESLQGETVLPPLVILCEVCGLRNSLHSFEAGSTRCANQADPHLLTVSWA